VLDLGRVFAEVGNRFYVKLRVSFARPDDLLVCDFAASDGEFAAADDSRGEALFRGLFFRGISTSSTVNGLPAPESFEGARAMSKFGEHLGRMRVD
jgi:hypothetical protein